MPRATTRKNAGESQPNGNSQEGRRTQRKNGCRASTQDEDEDARDEDARDEDEEMEDADGESGSTSERRANDLVRLALFTETRRGTLKREDITKKIFRGRVGKGEYEDVFERAQQILRNAFGMEMHEMMSRAERLRADAARDGANTVDPETNIGPAKKKVATSSKQYILRSVLHPTIIEAASIWDVNIEAEEKRELSKFHPDDEERQPEGTLIAWRSGSSDQLAEAGILHVILALILVNGRVLNENQLRAYLKRLRLPMGSTMPSITQSSQGPKTFTIEGYLAQLVKQGYLDRQKVNQGGNQGGQKRTRTSAAALGEDSDVNYEWRWGTRTLAEIGEEGIRDFVVEFMDMIEKDRERRGEEDEEDEDAASVAARRRREEQKAAQKKEKMITAIGRAAGGGI